MQYINSILPIYTSIWLSAEKHLHFPTTFTTGAFMTRYFLQLLTKTHSSSSVSINRNLLFERLKLQLPTANTRIVDTRNYFLFISPFPCGRSKYYAKVGMTSARTIQEAGPTFQGHACATHRGKELLVASLPSVAGGTPFTHGLLLYSSLSPLFVPRPPRDFSKENTPRQMTHETRLICKPQYKCSTQNWKHPSQVPKERTTDADVSVYGRLK
jgi:hypothetical protein